MIRCCILSMLFICFAFGGEKIHISVSVIPQSYFVKQIAGDLVDINVMVQKGKSPETYEPSIKQLEELPKSKVYFGIGVPFEDAWLDRFKSVNPNMLIVKPLKDGALDSYNEKYHHDEHHDHDEDHHGESIGTRHIFGYRLSYPNSMRCKSPIH